MIEMETTAEKMDMDVAGSGLDKNQQTQVAWGLTILRISLGVIILATWWSNITQDPNFYSEEGLRGFFNWVQLDPEEGGNGASLGFIHSLIDNTVLRAPTVIGFSQMIVEFFLGLGLLIGAFTRLTALLSTAFFIGLFLTYFGGEEWIFTYVILATSSFAVFLGWAGRFLGVDQAIAAARGESPGKLLW